MGGNLKIYSNTGSGLNSKFSVFNAPATGYGSFLYSADATFSLTIMDTYVECLSSYTESTVRANVFTS